MNICECDVIDKEKLALFKFKRAEWKKCLIEDAFSISKQIMNMLWNDTVFHTINEARRLTHEKNSKSIGFNGPLLEVFDQGFGTTQVMAIRRLTDPTSYDPNRAVFSLPSIIDDMREHSDLITRENYVCYEGIKFEGVSHDTDGINWMHWNRMQKNFDKISNTESANRTRDDKIDKKILKRLSKQLKVCDVLRTYANKFVAHASHDKNRIKLTENQKRITLESLDKCYKAIIRVASFIGVVVLYEHGLGGVPVPQFDHLKSLDKPMVSKDDIPILGKFWNDRVKEVDSWDNDIWARIMV
jgi:hypothetical protein